MTTRFRIWLQPTDGTNPRWVGGSFKTRKAADRARDSLQYRSGQLMHIPLPGVYTVIETLNGQAVIEGDP